MNEAEDTQTCCFVASTRDHPVRLFDSITGQVRTSYKTKDAQDETKSPLTCKFNLDGQKIYCGFENSIQIFDTGRPGTDCELVKLTPNRKSNDGIKGLIADISFNPDFSGLFAAGSYSGQIGLFDDRTNHLLLELLEPTISGVTQCRFSEDGSMLFSASRACNGIRVWDIRNTTEILHTFPRISKTNQRMTFSIFEDKLYTGHQDGMVTIYNTKLFSELIEFQTDSNECVGSVSVNMKDVSQIVTCSGERSYNIGNESDDEIETDRRQYNVSIWKI
jgi:WD40 repeat protein